VVAIAGLVLLQRLDDVGGVLAAQLGHAVNLREYGPVTGDAVAAGAHGSLGLAGRRITVRRVQRGREGNGDDKG